MNKTAVLKYFSGKSLARAIEALDILERCVEAGSWEPGVSRKVRAALNAQNKARLLERSISPILRSIPNKKYICVWMQAPGARTNEFAGLTGLGLVEAEAVESYTEWFDAWAPIRDALTRLDNTRPRTVVTKLGLSPLVESTLRSIGATSVDMPEIKFETIEVQTPKGVVYKQVGRIVWPEGTLHDTSPHCHDDGRFVTCHACGHRIYDAFGWVPLVAFGSEKPRSLWVGRNCAHNLFGIKVTGDLEVVGEQ